MKSPAERGPIGAWAFATRQERGLSVEQVADALTALGQSTRPATLRGVEAGGKRPSARLLRLLGEVLESEPPGVTAQAVPDSAAVVAAMDRQTAVLERIAEVLEGLDRASLRPALPADALRMAQAHDQLEGDLEAFEASNESRRSSDRPA